MIDFVSAKSKNPYGEIGDNIKDNGGLTSSSNEKDWDSFRNYIHSYNPQVSHYRLEHCSIRRYLELHFNIRTMWSEYNKTESSVSYYT